MKGIGISGNVKSSLSQSVRGGTMLEESMLRTPQAADYLGVSPATLAKWRVLGGGPSYKKLGRVVVYDPDDLRLWLEECSHRSTSQRAQVMAKKRVGGHALG
jgi:hypothetical protein